MFVKESIESVLSQNVDGVELIIVDDGSTDRSYDIIKLYEEKAKVLKIKNSGALRASLAGLHEATGQFIHFLDADDALCAGSLEVIISNLRPEISKLQFCLSPVDEHGEIIGVPFPNMSKNTSSQYLIDSIKKRGYYLTPPTSGNVYRRDVYNDLGDLTYERAIDGIPYLIAPFIGTVLSINRPLARYRYHSNNLSNFANISFDQLQGYARRFKARLCHLEKILVQKGISRYTFKIKDNYSYISEMNIMALVVNGERITLRTLRSHLKLVRSEFRGKSSFFFSALSIALFLLPSFLGKRLVRFRFDQSYLRAFRTLIKYLVFKRIQ